MRHKLTEAFLMFSIFLFNGVLWSLENHFPVKCKKLLQRYLILWNPSLRLLKKGRDLQWISRCQLIRVSDLKSVRSKVYARESQWCQSSCYIRVCSFVVISLYLYGKCAWILRSRAKCFGTVTAIRPADLSDLPLLLRGIEVWQVGEYWE